MNIDSSDVIPGGDHHPYKPEWIRISEVPRYFGISRSKCYELIHDKAIKSCSLRKRGQVQVKGTRLISYDSLSKYFEGLAEG